MEFLERFLSDFKFDALMFVFDILIPVFLAIIFGGLIGLQRERHERPAGLRTHSLVCLGATVFTLVSYLGFPLATGFDPSRVAAGVVTGIGFIGAGVIFRQGLLVKGVTTAASIWISAAIGLALGTSLYYLAVIVTICGLIILSILKALENLVIHTPFYTIQLTTEEDFKDIEEIEKILGEMSSDIKGTKYELIPDKDEKIYSFQLHSRTPDLGNKVLNKISRKKGVLKVSID